jgi:hypothetical protein
MLGMYVARHYKIWHVFGLRFRHLLAEKTLPQLVGIVYPIMVGPLCPLETRQGNHLAHSD